MKARNTIAILICIVILFALCACGTNTAEEDAFANNEQFLTDMAKGLSDRQTYMQEHTDFIETYTDEEMSVYFQELVSLELAQIEKYEPEFFEDSSFHELAHAYIDACQMQLLAAQNHQSEDLSKLWLSAGTIRSAIVSEIYARYDLPLSEKLRAIFD